MVENTHAAKQRLLTLPPVTVPAKVLRMDSPEYTMQRLQQPVAAGQLWMAKTNTGHQYVLVSGVSDDARLITVIPMSNDTAVRTEGALIVKDTPLCRPMVAWPELAAEVPVRILFKPLDEFDQLVARALADNRDDESLGIERATAPEDPTTSAEREIFEVRRRMETWHAMCSDLPKLHSDEERGSTTPERAEYVKSLVTVLGLSFADAAAVVDGHLALDDEQNRRLSDAGVHPERFRPRSFHLPKDLLVEIEQPMYRQIAQRYSANLAGDARLNLAKDAFALAARKSGYGQESWRGVIQQVLHNNRTSDDTEQ